MGHVDPMRAFLKQRGAPPHVVEAGLPGLVALREGFAQEVWRGYDLGLDDDLNDLDERTLSEASFAEAARDQALHAESDTGALRVRVAAADNRLRSATVTRKQCLRGEDVASRRGWS